MKATIHAYMDDNFMVKVEIDTNCPNINSIKDQLPLIDPSKEICQFGFETSEVYKWAKGLPHVACPMPCAIVKCVEVAGDMGLKKPVSMEFQ